MEWITIKNHPNYEIRINGDVRNKTTGKILKKSVGHCGYYIVNLNRKLRYIHRLLAEYFIPNPENKREVNHIDGDKLNCSIENLERTTSKENNEHARRTGLHTSDGDKAVVCMDITGNEVCVYKSISEASRRLKINRHGITYVCMGKPRYKTAGGFKRKYLNPNYRSGIKKTIISEM